MTTTITPDAPVPLTTDAPNNALSLQLLRLYASMETNHIFLLRRGSSGSRSRRLRHSCVA